MPIAVFVVFVLGSLISLLTGSDAGVGVGIVGLVVSFFAWWVLAVVFGYVGLAGVANYAREGTFAAGFEVGVITTAITSREYVMAWLYVILLNAVAGAVTSALNFVPVLGAIIGVFVSFYALIIAGWLWGDGFAAALDATSEPEPDVDATTA